MNISNGYNTKQKKKILDFLMTNENNHFTVDMIVEKIGGAVGRTTVYRYLERLVEQGTVQKYVGDSGSCACYQFINNENCHNHFHLKCSKCGTLIHLDCDEMEQMQKHIALEHNFKINSFQTVLYGICGECENK